MRILKRLLVFLVVLIVLLIIVAFFLPKNVHVERTVASKASPEAVYGYLNNLKTYDEWMPWNKIDPNMKKTWGDKSEGTGAWYSWTSDNSSVGKGKLTITESQPANSVKTSLDFEGQGTSMGGWNITPDGAGSKVTWYMDMNMGNNPMARWAGLFMDKMIGPQFESGLNEVSKLAESTPPAPKDPTIQIEETTTKPMSVIYIRDTANDSKEIGTKLGQIYGGELGAFMKKNSLKMVGAPLAWYNGNTAPFIFDAGVPVDKLPAKTEGRVKSKQVAGGKAVVAHFYGPYELTPKGYAAVEEWLKQHPDKVGAGPHTSYEIYIGDPGVEKDPYKILTDIVFPIK